jgi:hypothetical protein
MASAMLARAEVVYVVFQNKNKSSSNIKTIRVVSFSDCKITTFFSIEQGNAYFFMHKIVYVREKM